MRQKKRVKKRSKQLKSWFDLMKPQLKEGLEGMGELRALPERPAALKRHHPDIYSRLYADEQPAKCPFNVAEIRSLENSFKTRDHGSKGSSHAAVPTLQVQQPEVSSTVAAFGNMMVASMKEMAAMQKSLMVHMMGSGKPPTITMPKAKSLPSLKAPPLTTAGSLETVAEQKLSLKAA